MFQAYKDFLSGYRATEDISFISENFDNLDIQSAQSKIKKFNNGIKNSNFFKKGNRIYWKLHPGSQLKTAIFAVKLINIYLDTVQQDINDTV